MMDAFNDPTVEEIDLKLSSQAGKTEVLLNVLGYIIDQSPGPTLFVQPSLPSMKAWSKERLGPMLRDTAVLRSKVKDLLKEKDQDNEILHKVFPGGHLAMVGAASAAGLASRPIKYLLLDETDQYPWSVGVEGDPQENVKQRTKNFQLVGRKIVKASTPTIDGLSRIDNDYELSDKRVREVPCPECGAFQVLSWSQVEWPKDQPQLARYRCVHCDELLDDVRRVGMDRHGRWKATAPFNGRAGFHLSELYSPWSRLGELAQAFKDANKFPERLKIFVNKSLAETWKEKGFSVQADGLMRRCEQYKAEVPAGGVLLTAGVDVQDDRIECEVVAWGKEEENWGVKFELFFGNPTQPAVWEQLDEFLRRPFKHESGVDLRVSCCLVDSGFQTDQVYKFTKPREYRRVYACKGSNEAAGPPISRYSTSNHARAKVFRLNTSTVKDMVYNRLGIESDGPGKFHFPVGAGYDEEWFRQLAAEKLVTTFRKGKVKRSWVQTRPRNEALDVRVYATCAFRLLKVNMARLEKYVNAKAQKLKESGELPASPAPVQERQEEQSKQARRRRGTLSSRRGWLRGWTRH